MAYSSFLLLLRTKTSAKSCIFRQIITENCWWSTNLSSRFLISVFLIWVISLCLDALDDRGKCQIMHLQRIFHANTQKTLASIHLVFILLGFCISAGRHCWSRPVPNHAFSHMTKMKVQRRHSSRSKQITNNSIKITLPVHLGLIEAMRTDAVALLSFNL